MAIRRRLRGVTDPNQRRFWSMLNLAFAFWIGTDLLGLAFTDPWPVVVNLSYVTLCFGFCAAVAMGLESRPHLEPARFARRLRTLAQVQLGAGIAHELNQPLAAILAFAETIREEPQRKIGEYSEELKLIREQTLRMAEIVDTVRGFARQSRLELKTTRALEPVDKALMLVSERLRRANIEVVRSPEEGLPSIWGDSLRLQEIFLGLLTNSLQAFDVPDGALATLRGDGAEAPLRGDVRKQVILGARASGGFVEYTIEDNGPGVPEGLVSTLFDPFVTTREVGKGMGLGLSLAYGIAKEHRGDMRYESRPGGGARFILQVPISAEAHSRSGDCRGNG